MPELNLISTRDACRLLGDIDKSTLTTWVKLGKIKPAHRGQRTSGFLWDRAYIEKFAEDLRILAAAPPVDSLPGLEVGR